MQASSSTQEILYGVAVLVVAAPFIWGASVLISRLRNAKFARAWQPLVPVIDGTITGDGVASTSLLSGRYGGREVVASMTPEVRRSPSQYHENRFAIELPGLPGRSDWSVAWKDGLLGFGEPGWQIDTDDEALENRLRNAGVLDIVRRLGRTRVSYRKQYGMLRLDEDVQPLLVPHPERFRLQLDTLGELAAVNAAANSDAAVE